MRLIGLPHLSVSRRGSAIGPSCRGGQLQGGLARRRPREGRGRPGGSNGEVGGPPRWRENRRENWARLSKRRRKEDGGVDVEVVIVGDGR